MGRSSTSPSNCLHFLFQCRMKWVFITSSCTSVDLGWPTTMTSGQKESSHFFQLFPTSNICNAIIFFILISFCAEDESLFQFQLTSVETHFGINISFHSTSSPALYPCLGTTQFLKLWVNIDPTQLCHCCQTRMRPRCLIPTCPKTNTPGSGTNYRTCWFQRCCLTGFKLASTRTRFYCFFSSLEGFTIIDIVLDAAAPQDLQTLLRFWTFKAKRRQFLGARFGGAAACE